MDVHRVSLLSVRTVCLLSLCGCVCLAGCSSSEKTQPASAAPSTETAAKPAPKTPFVPVDACSLLSKADAEVIIGKPVSEPSKETAANLVTCSYKVLSLALFTGEEGAYYAGPVAQAKDTFETGRKNAASVEKVSGLGQDAYWDSILHILHVYKDRYDLDVTVDSDLGLKVARAAAEKAVAKLP
jgi:hypothetical protein